jgi:hypothetical protein
MINAENPYDFEVDWPTKFWSNSTIDFLKDGPWDLGNTEINIKWINYNGSSDRCKHKNGLYDDLDPQESTTLYCGTVSQIKLFQTKLE